MKPTRDQILAASERQLDEMSGVTFGFRYKTEYWAMDREEEGIFITFDSRAEADNWMTRQAKVFKARVDRCGIHIVEKRIYPRVSSDRNATAEIFAKMRDRGQHVQMMRQMYQIIGILPTTVESGSVAVFIASPAQIVKAALIAAGGVE